MPSKPFSVSAYHIISDLMWVSFVRNFLPSLKLLPKDFEKHLALYIIKNVESRE